MNEVRDSSSKTVTFLCLGICLFLFVYVIAGKFIKEISPEELAKTGNKSRFKMQAQLVHKNVNEEFQKLFIMNKDVIFSDCNESHKKIIIKTIVEEKVNYYVKINSNTHCG